MAIGNHTSWTPLRWYRALLVHNTLKYFDKLLLTNHVKNANVGVPTTSKPNKKPEPPKNGISPRFFKQNYLLQIGQRFTLKKIMNCYWIDKVKVL